MIPMLRTSETLGCGKEIVCRWAEWHTKKTLKVLQRLYYLFVIYYNNSNASVGVSEVGILKFISGFSLATKTGLFQQAGMQAKE